MNMKQERVLFGLEIFELILSIIGVILFLGLSVIVKTEMRYMFIFIYIHFGYNTIKCSSNVIKYVKSRKTTISSNSELLKEKSI